MLAECLRIEKKVVVAAAVTICWFLVVGVSDCLSLERSEVLRYEVTWNGNKAGHGDIAN